MQSEISIEDKKIDGYEPVFMKYFPDIQYSSLVESLEDLLPETQNLTQLLKSRELLGNTNNNIDTIKNNIIIKDDMSVYDIIMKAAPKTWERAFFSALSEVEAIDIGLKNIEKEFGPYIPGRQNLFKAFELCPLDKLKVVIIGQDPYHTVRGGKMVANGMSFSTNRGLALSPSLKNIYKELERSYPNFVAPKHGDLSEWAKQGVLLLNSSLTVTKGQVASHKKLWIGFIHKVLSYVQQKNSNIIFVLWGRTLQSFISSYKIISSKAITFESSHPGPSSVYRGFMSCNHFIDINEKLIELGKEPINWVLSQ